MSQAYVLEQMFVSAGTELQLVFAETAAEKLRPMPGLWPEPTGSGLLLLGTTELVLDMAQTLLYAVFGAAVCAGPRRVCYLRDPHMEPIMDVFVRAAPAHAEAVVAGLRRREALLRISTGDQHGWLVRAQAPMAALLGYGRELAAETGASADHWITFNRWEPRPQVDAAPERSFREPAGV